jgi:hypothetical protein
MAHLIWREKDLGTLHITPHVRERYSEILQEKLSTIKEEPPADPVPILTGYGAEPESEEYRRAVADSRRAAEDQARKELGDEYELIKIGEAATFDGLIKELDIRERLEAAIARCLRQEGSQIYLSSTAVSFSEAFTSALESCLRARRLTNAGIR